MAASDGARRFLPAPVKSWAAALLRLTGRQLREEWFGSPPHLWLISRPRPEGQAGAPRDFRPARLVRGRAILAGRFDFAGQSLDVGVGGDVWNRPASSRAFAVQLHRMDWLRDVVAAGADGSRVALSNVLGWHAVFGRWNSFSFAAPALGRRVFNLACALKPLMGQANEAEAAALLSMLARQARHLLLLQDGPRWAAERATAVAVAGCALGGKAGDLLLAQALARLEPALPVTVLADGGHGSRSPEAGLELLFDLLSLDDALLQIGSEAPADLARAIDRLAGAQRFFTMPDGQLACFQGGETSEADRVSAAATHDSPLVGAAPAQPSPSAPHVGFEKLIGRRVMAIIDTARPAAGAWSATACAQPLALELFGGRDRLISNSGWSPRAEDHQALRLTPAGSTATLAASSIGAPLEGLRARMLGPRLEGPPMTVELRRHDAEHGSWLELSHDGWVPSHGLLHHRRLFLDMASDELRAEDRVIGVDEAVDRRRLAQFTVRFHLYPGVRASLAMDQNSVLLKGPSDQAWWLRSDAAEVTLEPSIHLFDGRARRTSQVVMHGLIQGPERAGRVRWKLAAANT